MSFHDKVILITGASSGIGAGAALYLAKKDAKLAIVGRNKENLQKTHDECKKANNNCEILQIEADVNLNAKLIVDKTIEHFGKLNVLINSAGILASGSVITADLEQFDRMLNTNVRSIFELTKYSVPHLIETKGNIVNVSSVTGTRSFPNALTYCMTKAALDQFTKCTALDLAPMGVRVNSINPGVIVTEVHKRGGMNDEQYSAFLEKSKTTHALGRVGTTEETAAAIAFLASDEASFTTGELLSVDGGRSCMCPR